MVNRKLTNGKAARIILETTIFQEDEVFKNTFDEMGRIVSINGNYYLRFVEKNSDIEIPTLIKIFPNGNINIIRNAENKTRLEFNEKEYTYTNYHTPAGIMKMRVQTNRIDSSYQNTPFAGDIEIDYLLSVGEKELGSYQIRLRFTT